MATQFAFEKIVTNGLVLAADPADTNSYPGSGTSWRDMSGNNNNGALTNGPIFDSGSIKSIFFDGTNDLVNFGASSSLNVTNNVSFDIWFKLGNNYGVVGSTYGGIIAKRTEFSGISTFGVNQNGTGNLFQIYFNSVGSYQVLSFSTSQYFSPNIWVNLSATFLQSGGNTIITAYKNGFFISSGSFAGNIPAASSANVTVGCSYLNQEFTNMNCGPVKVYNRALSALEVLQNYNAQKSRFNL
jgi:hypothetical protein